METTGTTNGDSFHATELPPDPDERNGNSPFPIVGVGASAGGLEAVTQLLSHLPTPNGMAFLVVQHLDPHHTSRLAELLSRATKMKVLEAMHGIKVERDHVYVIPPNTSMAIGQGRVLLTPRTEAVPHLPVDYLFRSIAADQVSRAIGVVLSGTGSDGTQGVCEVKSVGGITFAQEEGTAAHAGMPHSAIESGCVDFVLSPENIARRLAELGDHPYLVEPSAVDAAQPAAEQSYRRILHAVHTQTGVDFSQYRDTTIKRRIARRMALHGLSSVAAFAEKVRSVKEEADALYHDLLIHVTSFFRDPEMFEALKTGILPELVRGKAPNDQFRVWVPGCSTGQEAYSLAMTLVEFYDEKPIRPTIQVFATDLSDQAALDKARAGVYPEGIELEVSPERLRRFFRREDHSYRIDKSIRDMCVFARHNVTSDPPFSHVDLISCRNVLIYLSTPLQKRILPTFHYALRVPGYLILGSAETVGEHADLFDLVEREHRIYAKKGGAVRQQVFFPAPDMRSLAAYPRRPGMGAPVAHDVQREADRILLGRYAPPGVLVDENFEILQFRGRTSAFLESPAGDPTTNVLKMAREGLFLELRNALTEASKQNAPVTRSGVRLRTPATVMDVTIEVVPMHLAGGGKCYLILFHDSAAPGQLVELPAVAEPADPDASREAAQVRQELAATREYLQSMIEQQDAANEELRSANEEILSSNEELQSTNEELETAKEELQSANEELTTVNEQLQRSNQELDQANSDLVNLLSSTNIPVVMVGREGRIRRFTPPAARMLSLLSTDVGRPLSDLKPAIAVTDLDQIIIDVIDRVRAFERKVRDGDGRWHMLRVYPYRTADNRIDGAVLLLVDIDQFERDQENLLRQSTLIELSQDAVIIRDADERTTFWNRGAEAMYGWTAEEAMSKRIDELLRTTPEAFRALNKSLERSDTFDGELVQVRKDGDRIVVHAREVLLRDARGKRTAILAIKRNITEQKRTIATLKEADRRKDEFLATLAHELRNPLAPIRNAVEIMRLAGNDRAVIERSRQVLDRQAGQLARIVEDLIDLSRITEKKIELRRELVPVRRVVEAALETCRLAIERNRQTLTVILPDEDLYLDVDPGRMSQVLVNLLNNASKHSGGDGEIWLTVEGPPASGDSGNGDQPRSSDRRKTRRRGPDFVSISVRDEGSGIAASLLPHVFEMFTQGPRTTHQGRGGLGVGLALVRSLVEMHGGKVEARSEGAGEGSEFVIWLPQAEAPPESRKAPTPRRTSRRAASRRIIVVDDNDDQVQSLGMLLTLMGHKVHQASSGPEAIEKALAFKPELMLIDIGLPDMEGFEVARRIRAEPRLKNVVLVAQTGWGADDDRRRSREAGFDSHLVKPVTRAALEDVVRNLPK